MNYFIKPVLLAGLGLFAATGTLSTVNAKEPVKAGITVDENRTDGHYETQIVYETRYDSWGRPFQVAVERRVWVNDGPGFGMFFGLGGGHHHYHHDHHHSHHGHHH